MEPEKTRANAPRQDTTRLNGLQRDLVLDTAKHLLTLSTAALGFVITIMFTGAGGEPLIRATEYKNSLQTSLIAFLVCIVLGFLVQGAVLSQTLRESPRFVAARPGALLLLAWAAFMVGVAAFFVFAWATMFGVAPLRF